MNSAITQDGLIARSTEFVCMCWGPDDDAGVHFFAPVTRWNHAVWVHPAWAREYPWPEIRRKATRVWRISGSFWNPGEFQLLDLSALSPL